MYRTAGIPRPWLLLVRCSQTHSVQLPGTPCIALSWQQLAARPVSIEEAVCTACNGLLTGKCLKRPNRPELPSLQDLLTASGVMAGGAPPVGPHCCCCCCAPTDMVARPVVTAATPPPDVADPERRPPALKDASVPAARGKTTAPGSAPPHFRLGLVQHTSRTPAAVSHGGNTETRASRPAQVSACAVH